MLREVVRTKLLEMAAKSIKDIPDGWAVHVFPFSMTSVEFTLRDEKGIVIAIVRTLLYPKCQLWEVANSHTSISGWGPFMYDVAMEHASGYRIRGVTNVQGGLMSDRWGSSDAADAVWRHYYENRPDVQKQYMSELPWSHCDTNEHAEERHSSFYRKEPDILPRLEAAGKLVVDL